MPYFITIQYPYQHLTVTLSEDTTIISTETISKFNAIGLLIPAIKQILTNNNLTLASISCIGVNTGPGPFNTLRSIIATANGISFAKQIPLIPCNGLELLLQESETINQIAILDAFGNDAYYAIKSSQEQGYNSIKNIVNQLNQTNSKETINFIGNGAIKHKEFILDNFNGIAQFNENIIFASTQNLVNETNKKYAKNEIEKELFPLYLTSPVVKS